MVKLTLRERESIQEAVRRFRKLVERSGIKKEMRRREYYEKPSEIRRRRSRSLGDDAERVLALVGDNLWAEIDLNELVRGVPELVPELREQGLLEREHEERDLR